MDGKKEDKDKKQKKRKKAKAKAKKDAKKTQQVERNSSHRTLHRQQQRWTRWNVRLEALLSKNHVDLDPGSDDMQEEPEQEATVRQ
jgi:hypothetical protein